MNELKCSKICGPFWGLASFPHLQMEILFQKLFKHYWHLLIDILWLWMHFHNLPQKNIKLDQLGQKTGRIQRLATAEGDFLDLKGFPNTTYNILHLFFFLHDMNLWIESNFG